MRPSCPLEETGRYHHKRESNQKPRSSSVFFFDTIGPSFACTHSTIRDKTLTATVTALRCVALRTRSHLDTHRHKHAPQLVDHEVLQELATGRGPVRPIMGTVLYELQNAQGMWIGLDLALFRETISFLLFWPPLLFLLGARAKIPFRHCVIFWEFFCFCFWLNGNLNLPT